MGTLKKYRESELKHGRVAMLAVLGVLVQELGFTPFFNTPQNDTEQYVDLGPAAFQFQALERTEPFVITYLLINWNYRSCFHHPWLGFTREYCRNGCGYPR